MLLLGVARERRCEQSHIASHSRITAGAHPRGAKQQFVSRGMAIALPCSSVARCSASCAIVVQKIEEGRTMLFRRSHLSFIAASAMVFACSDAPTTPSTLMESDAAVASARGGVPG